VALLLAAAGIVVIASAQAVRAIEATIAAALIGPLTRTQTYVWGSRGSFYWGMGTDHAHGIRITGECSLAYVAGPLLIGFGLLLLLKRLPSPQVVLGAAVGVALMLTVNTFRLLLIAGSIHRWNTETAVWWAHVVLGSMVAVVGNVVGMAVALTIAFRNRPGAP
jgi:exosortase/archaeosortase family protein